MPGLHEFDLMLVEYVRENFIRAMPPSDWLDRLKEHAPAFEEFFCNPPDPGETYGSTAKFLLNDDELQQLRNLAEVEFHDSDWVLPSDPRSTETPESNSPQEERPWRVYRELHRVNLHCAEVIRQKLSEDVAKTWLADSAEYVRELESPGLSLGEGIEAIRHLLWNLREHKLGILGVALLPAPDGEFPTPTNPDPPKIPRAWPTKEKDMQRMRKAIAASEFGNKTISKTLIKNAKINKQRGLDALRELEKLGEYKGFTLEKSDRYAPPAED